ncbi:MAG TPA: GNAT family N-acetyltransferase [Caulobacteraceae bacterium]|jgi:GNAT superfamily N-acetyltransferase
MPFETQHGEFTVTDDPARFDLARAHHWLCEESYWDTGIPLETFARAVANSLVIGIYTPSGEMVALARVVTDKATFAWIGDVFVDASLRGHGLGKALMTHIQAHPDLQGLRRTHLATRDAHSLYAHFGFVGLTGADRWMEIRGAPYR